MQLPTLRSLLVLTFKWRLSAFNSRPYLPFSPSSIVCKNHHFKISTHILNSLKFCRFKSAYRTALYGWAASAPPQLVEPASRLSRDNAVLPHHHPFPSNSNFYQAGTIMHHLHCKCRISAFCINSHLSCLYMPHRRYLEAVQRQDAW